MKHISLSVWLGMGIVALSLTAKQAYADASRFGHRRHAAAHRELGADRAEIWKDRAELHRDRKELFQDRAELRRDLRRGAGPGEIARDRAEIRRDLEELRGDRGELRGDYGELRRDSNRFGSYHYPYGRDRYAGEWRRRYGWANDGSFGPWQRDGDEHVRPGSTSRGPLAQNTPRTLP